MNFYTWDDLGGFVTKASAYVAYRYRNVVELEDVRQEVWLWLYTESNRKRVIKWLSNEPQQTTRIYRSLLDAGLSYAEVEKARIAGYKPDDVWWYTPTSIEGLLPLALDRSFTQENGLIGEQITAVIDVRSALDETSLFDYFGSHDSDHEDWRVNLQLVLDRLGGERPAVGRRKVLSNAQATAITSASYE
jgi:hypothetical protein